MRSTKISCFSLLAILFLSVCFAFAQNPKRIPVSVLHSGDDQIGQRYAFALKEAIRRSQSFKFVNYESMPTSPRLVVYLSSVDSFTDKGVSSAIALSIAYDSSEVAGQGILLSTNVINCGRTMVDTCVQNDLAAMIWRPRIYEKSCRVCGTTYRYK